MVMTAERQGTTFSEVKAEIRAGVTITYRRHPWHSRKQAIRVTHVTTCASRTSLLYGHPVSLNTGTVKTWKERSVLLYADSEVNIVSMPEEGGQ